MVVGEVGGRSYNTLRIVIYAGNEKTRVGERDQFQLARLQEFGTQEMPANPFFFVTWRTKRQRVRSRITRSIRAAIKREAG